MANEWMVPAFTLASMRREERTRASQPLLLTALPGSAAQKTAVAAVAVTQQARDGLRQERRVAEQTVDAVADAAAYPAAFGRERLTQSPALRAVASDALVARIQAVPPMVARPVASQLVDAVADAAANPAAFDRDRLDQWPALRAIASDALVTSIKGLPSMVDQRISDQAVDALKLAIALPKDQKLDKADAAKFPELVAHLTDAQKADLFKA